MIRLAILILIALLATPSLAQQQQPIDPAFMQRAIAALQTQRNASQDALAVAEARVMMLQEEVTKLQARISELEKQPPSSSQNPPAPVVHPK